MKSVGAYSSFLDGSSYDIGRMQGEEIKKIPDAVNRMLLSESVDETSIKEIKMLIDQYSPGLNEELQGFADALNVKTSQLNFYTDSWLKPGGCSLSAILPTKTIDNKTYVLRNYDLSTEISDMRLCTTKAKGRYNHTGFSVSYLGRSEGLNEMGFCVAFASCGMPIGSHPGMKKPVSKGLQFMIIVRALLENCKNVEEGIYYLKDMPIGTNMNLMLADAEGNAALIETYDGEKEIKIIDKTLGFMNATNHGVLPDIIKKEKVKLQQSIVRFRLLEDNLKDNNFISKNQLRRLVLKEFPQGLTVHNYQQDFGTVHSILFNLEDKVLEFSFGSPILNKVHKITVGEELPFHMADVIVENTDYGQDFWKIIE